jgi:tetratricopeptide (TPR) repeat protein
VNKSKQSYTLAGHFIVGGHALHTLKTSLAFGVAAVAMAFGSSHLTAWAAEGLLHSIRFDPASRHFLMETTGSVKASLNTLTIAGRKRVIIDLENTDISGDLPRDTLLLQDLREQLPALKNITVNEYGGNGRPIVRVLLDLQGEPGSVHMIRNQGPHIELELSDYADAGSSIDVGAPLISKPKHPIVQAPDNALNLPSHATTYPSPSNYGDNPLRSAQSAPIPTQSHVQRIPDVRNTYGPSSLGASSFESASAQRSSQAQSTQTQRNTATASQLEQIKRTLVNMNNRYAQLEQENNGLKRQIADLGKQRSTDHAAGVSQLQSQLDFTSNRNTELNAQVQTLTGRVNELQSRLDHSRNENTSSPKLDEMKRTLVTMNQRYDQLNQEKQLLSQQLEQARQQSQLQAKQQATQAEANRDQRLQQALQEKSIQEQKLQQALQDKSSQEQQLQQALQDKSNQEQQLQQVSQEKAQLSQQIASLKTQLASRTTASTQANVSSAELQDLRQKLSQAQQAMTDSLKTIQEQNQEMAYLRNQVNTVKAGMSDAAKTQISSLQSAAEQKDGTIRDLRQQLSVAQVSSASNARYESQLAELKNQVETVNQQLQDKSAKLQASESRQQELQQQAAMLKAQLTQMEATENQLQNAQQQLASAKTQITQLQADEGQLKAAQQDLSGLKAEVERLKVLQAATAKASKSSSNTAQNTQAQKQVQDLSQQLSVLRQENADLKTSLSSKPSNTASSAGANPDAEAAYQEAKTAQKAKKTIDALDKYKQALLLDPGNGRYAVDYSAALSEDHQYAEAIDVLRRYLQRNPVDRDAYNQLGKVYLLNDQADAANQSFTRAIPISTLNNYATSLKKLGRMGEAENVFKLALSINPKDSEVLFNLGNLYNNQNKLPLARDKYLEAIQVRPDFAEAHYNLGLIFSKLGNNVQAVAHLEKFLQLSPNARNAETIRAYVQKLKA